MNQNELKPIKVELVSTEDNVIYLNGTFYNDTTFGQNPRWLPAYVVQERATSFLKDAKYYDLVPLRFNITNATPSFRVYDFPLWDASATPMSVGVSYNGKYYDEPVVIPEVSDPVGNTLRATKSVYQYLKIINDAWADAQAAMITDGGPTGSFGSPCMAFDNKSGLYSIYIPEWYGEGGGITGASPTGSGWVGVNMSHHLYQRFQSLPVQINVPLQNQDHDVNIDHFWWTNNKVSADNISVSGVTGGGTGDYFFAIEQDGAWANSVEDYYKLEMVTTTLPIRQEFTDGTELSKLGSGGNNKSFPIVTDFLIGKSGDNNGLLHNNAAEPYVYIDTPPYRRISMYGNGELFKWDLQWFVRDRYGQQYPMYIGPGGVIDVKLAFIRKQTVG